VFWKSIICVGTTIGLLVLGGWFILQSPREELASITIKNTKIKVELADTAEKKSYGLSGRNSLPENRGMLFVYDKPEFYSFWMKDMQFSIDIIWINESYRVVDITKSVPLDSFPQSFQPQRPAQYVLEVSAGFSDKNDIRIGDMMAGLELE